MTFGRALGRHGVRPRRDANYLALGVLMSLTAAQMSPRTWKVGDRPICVALGLLLAVSLLVPNATLAFLLVGGFDLLVTGRLVSRIGSGLPILELIAFICVLQWLLAPAVHYLSDVYHPKYQMYVTPAEYFAYALPASIAYLALCWRRLLGRRPFDSRSEKRLFRPGLETGLHRLCRPVAESQCAAGSQIRVLLGRRIALCRSILLLVFWRPAAALDPGRYAPEPLHWSGGFSHVSRASPIGRLDILVIGAAQPRSLR